MNRRHLAQLALITTLAIALRLYLFEKVGVFGDYGYWAYDVRMITHGQTPYLDFPGRSPLMLYTLTATRTIFGMHPYILRGTVITLWLLTAIPVYLLTRDIHTHTAATIALIAFLLLPYPLIYGMFLNSQSLGALLALTALYLTYRYPTTHGYAIAGLLTGTAYLSRRATLMYLIPLAAWGLYTTKPPTPNLSRNTLTSWLRRVTPLGAAVTTGFFTTLTIGYLAIAHLDPPIAYAIFNIDFIGLFTSGGRGAYPLVGVHVPPVDPRVKNSIPILNTLCPACGAWAARRALKMLLLAGPIVGILAWYLRDIVYRVFTNTDRLYLSVALGILALYTIYLAAINEFYPRAIFTLAILLFAIAITYTENPVPRRVLYKPGTALVLGLYASIVVGYLLRERRLIVYYMMDAWPAISILTGIITITWLKRLERRDVKLILAIAITTTILVSLATAVPLANVYFGDTNWFTLNIVMLYSADLTHRTTPGDRVWSPHPAYVAGSDALLYRNDSRSYMTLMLHDDAEYTQRYIAELKAAMREGRVEYVVVDRRTRDVYGRYPSLRRLVRREYRVAAHRPYRRTNATLLKHHGSPT